MVTSNETTRKEIVDRLVSECEHFIVMNNFEIVGLL